MKYGSVTLQLQGQASGFIPTSRTHKMFCSHGLQTAPKQAQLHLVPQHDITRDQVQMPNL